MARLSIISVLLLVLAVGCGSDTPDVEELLPPKSPTIHQHDVGQLDDAWGPDAVFDGIHIEWDANEEDDLEGYRIYRATSSDGPFVLIDEVDKSETLYEDRSVQREIRHFYRVTAFNEDNLESTMSEIVAYTLLPVAVPVNPQNHAVLGEPEPIFDWIAVGGAAWYLIRLEANTNEPSLLWKPIWISDPVFSFDHFKIPYDQDGRATEALETGREYRWRVDVVGDRTVGSESDWQYFTTEFP